MSTRKTSRPTRRRTNTEFIADVMDYSRFGPMAQLFVLEAVRRYAEQCAKAPASALESGLINGELWKAVAKDILRQCEEHFDAGK